MKLKNYQQLIPILMENKYIKAKELFYKLKYTEAEQLVRRCTKENIEADICRNVLITILKI